ncbi:ATP-binding protein [Larkinella sp. VNQ87]|uniref:sensor histidine kinase n=1 Tax=Larkinella sp. VNQ87 TaxID=3400921 RepID=UPI003C045371
MIRSGFRFSLFVCLFVCVLAGMWPVVAQTAKPPKQERVPEGGWWFRAGDSLAWKNPAYNHQRWERINPGVDLDDNPTLWKSGRGWFRRVIRFRSLEDTTYALTFKQFGASDVYLDGKLIETLRPDGFDSGGSQRISAVVPIRIADTSRHVLAVRYSFRRDPLIGLVVDKKPFNFSMAPVGHSLNDLIDQESYNTGVALLVTGIMGILSLLHFLFYRANPTQSVNRVLSLTMLAIAFTFLLDQLKTYAGTLTASSLLQLLSWTATYASFGLMLLSLYTYLERRKGWIFWSLIGLLVGTFVYTLFIDPTQEDNAWIPFLLILVEYIRVSWLARRLRRDYDVRLPWKSLRFSFISLFIIVGGIVVAAFGIESFRLGNRPELLAFAIILLVLLAFLSVPMGLSLSLVGDYARTYQSLRKQLEEVRRLSAQTLVQEQEKQQILATQNELLERQVTKRTAELNQSLAELRTTQAQLIQSAKMASLGELTAGIAHEIQNPLNFVNNFSELSTELADELKEGPLKQLPESEQAYAQEILGDLTQNLQKISHHGQRASLIVKGMLEHSRNITGERQPTDLNALTEEHLMLAYHGFRTKDRFFEARLSTDFSLAVGLIQVVPQEIGRVLLNLFGNAFYALQQKGRASATTGYEPELTVSTQATAQHVVLTIRDNGTGIPAAVREKVFQPFFTTKPTGEGTGLGLSLSYDIITKGYGGQLEVASEEGAYTEFILRLPR